MTEPLKQDQRVIADTSIDGIYQDGTAYVIPIVIGEEGKDFWRYPLVPDVVERLSEAGFDGYWAATGNPFVAWGSPLNTERDREHWRSAIAAIFAELLGER